MRGWVLWVASIACVSTAQTPPPPGAAPALERPAASDGAIPRIAEQVWEASVRHAPLWATYLGDHRYDQELPDLTEAAEHKWYHDLKLFQTQLEQLPLEGLTPEDEVTARYLLESLYNMLATKTCARRLWDVDQLAGWQVTLPEFANYHPVATPEGRASYLARLQKMGDLWSQHIQNLQTGLAKGLTAPKPIVQRVLAQLEAMLAAPLDQSPFVAAARRPEVHEEDRKPFAASIKEVLERRIHPMLTGYQRFLRELYLPKARAEEGVGGSPAGDRCYRALIREHTGVNQVPDVLHELGLSILHGLREEMTALAKREGFASVDLYREALKQAPAQFKKTADELLQHNRALVAQASARLPEAFGLLPPWGVSVIPIEAYRAGDAPAAYYYEAADDQSRPAYYYVNTLKPETRPLYNMEALAFHEAVPGHHLQISIAQSQKELPKIRQHGDVTAFIEGWALYAELLAEEFGWYSSPAARFGMLNYQAWRASRLVVDTGLHAFGWSRQRALEFMKEQVNLPEQEIANEVDRYIIWPAQALAYMVGRLEFQRLRHRAEEELGARFKLADFHDTVLKNGALPMPVVESVIETWMFDQKAQGILGK